MRKFDESRVIKITNTRYREHYHIQTPGGWLNDPNGLCFFKGYYHVFYQYHPYSAEWGPMHWGHVRSKDLVHWENLPVALVPGDSEDAGGCFSGSAIVKDNRLYLIYTGHHYYDDGDQNHFWENQNVAYSDDGIHFTKYDHNPIIEAPKDNSQDFRDPKVWQHGDHYYLVLGSREQQNNRARILLYQSSDLLHWEYRGAIAKAKDIKLEGSMWECPDFFRINGQDVLTCSPMGIKPQRHRFLNLNQSAAFVGHFDYDNAHFTHNDLHLLDDGHNFYAPQSFLTPDGRRIQFGWFSSFDKSMPEQADGWAGALTLPRELILHHNQVGAIPAQETKLLRTREVLNTTASIHESQQFAVPDPQHVEWNLTFNLPDYGSRVSWELANSTHSLIVFSYDQASGEITVRQHNQATDRYASIGQVTQLQVRIFVDTSSVEIFVNDGAATFTERYYNNHQTIITKVDANKPIATAIKAYHLDTKG
ncbi:glycoside hydrolase family 32 protein [Limosilactobacillus walteri]|uniref:Sucrose-6-phosphate hydrolase n=1 Tax=Limosilactobacillus walteri TaxID=2268022 RepID=A0ABR8P8K7_9LACO|nr:sucrose-6-phosphate hydrolase [Limosilactobacillus walteri]MBD5807031.1 glycoside hydrolase family 32 protein [Limosilactobacillus walteri]